jgi:predicted phosphodiesterase
MKNLFFGVFTALVLSGCIKYSPYEVTVSKEESAQTRKNLEKLAQLDQSGDTITFAFIGDTQRFYDESLEFVSAINRRNDIEFLIISGDLTDFGLDDEFTAIYRIFKKLNVPFLTVIGNHDLIYNGEEVYEEMYGPLDYAFYFKRMKFVMVNTNSREFAFNGKVPDIGWLDRELADTATYINAVVIGHVPPNHDDFDSRLELPYANTLAKWGKTLASMNGHRHNFKVDTPYNDGIIYLNSYSIGKGFYTVVRMWPGGFTFENYDL